MTLSLKILLGFRFAPKPNASYPELTLKYNEQDKKGDNQT